MEGRTYRYYEGEPLYPFGYGLSYSAFKYTNLQVTPTSLVAGNNVSVKVTVQNVGLYDADEVSYSCSSLSLSLSLSVGVFV